MPSYVKAVCISGAKGQPKIPVDSIELKTDYGISDDAHASADTHRQVSLLDETSIDIMRQKGYNAVDGDFGENIVTADLPINELGIGTLLQIGAEAQIQVSQIGKECHTPCAIGRRTGECIMPKEGLFTEVIKGGMVKANDEIKIVKSVSRSVIQAVVITVSDRCHAGTTRDESGPTICQMLINNLNANIAKQYIVPDERDDITRRLRQFSALERHIDLIFTTGGTGFAPRDVTPEATADIIERNAPGLVEAIRQASLAVTPHAMLSRAAAGIRNRTLIVNLPGSVKAVKESLEIILPVLPHAVELLRGTPVDCGRLS